MFLLDVSTSVSAVAFANIRCFDSDVTSASWSELHQMSARQSSLESSLANYKDLEVSTGESLK